MKIIKPEVIEKIVLGVTPDYEDDAWQQKNITPKRDDSRFATTDLRLAICGLRFATDLRLATCARRIRF